MPKNDDGLRDLLNRLENKFDKHSSEIQNVDRNLATLQVTADNHTKEIDKLGDSLADMRGRTVTWGQLKVWSVVFGAVILPLMTGITAGAYRWVLPQKIETVVSGSTAINRNFSDQVNIKLTPINNQLTLLDKNVAEIGKTTTDTKNELKSIVTALRPGVNRKTIVPRLKRNTTGDLKSLRQKLPTVRNLLKAVQTFDVPLERQDYKDLSIRLYDQYIAAKTAEEKSEFLATFIAAANAKSVSDEKLHRPSDPSFARQKEANNYFEGTIDLSSKDDWTGTVFKNCSITISKPDKSVILENVQFLDCAFDSIAPTPQARDFLSTYLESTRSTVTFRGYKVQILAYSVNNKWRTVHKAR